MFLLDSDGYAVKPDPQRASRAPAGFFDDKAEIRTKPHPVVKTAPTHQLGVPATRVASVVDRTSELPNEVPKPTRGGGAGPRRGCGAVPDHDRGGVATTSRGHVRRGENDRVGPGDGRPAPDGVRRPAQRERQRCQVAEQPRHSKAQSRPVSVDHTTAVASKRVTIRIGLRAQRRSACDAGVARRSPAPPGERHVLRFRRRSFLEQSGVSAARPKTRVCK